MGSTRGDPDQVPAGAAGQLHARLRELYVLVGEPQVKRMMELAGLAEVRIGRTTIYDLLNRRGVPTWRNVLAFVNICREVAAVHQPPVELPEKWRDRRWLESLEELRDQAAREALEPNRDEFAPEPSSRNLLTELVRRGGESGERFHATVPDADEIYVDQLLHPVSDSGAEPVSVDELVALDENAVIIGGPGSGKSNLVVRLAARSARRWQAGDANGDLPVWIPAAELQRVDTVEDALAGFWQETDVDFTLPPAPKRRWLICVDALDEIANPVLRDRVRRMMTACRRSHFRFVVTTRPLPAAEMNGLCSAQVTTYHLRGFTSGDVRAFSRNWFARRPIPGEDQDASIERFLGSIRSARLLPLLRIPLLVTMAALLFEEAPNRELPRSRAGLYEEFVRLLLGARRLESAGSGFASWVTAHRGRLVEMLAGEVVTSGNVSSATTLGKIVSWCRRTLPADLVEPLSDLAIIDVLRGQLADTGLFVIRGQGIEFLHHSVAEYVAAAPHLRSFDERDLHEPITRDIALFALARSGASAEPVADRLLSDGDAIGAGYLLLDGLIADERLQVRVVDGLMASVREDLDGSRTAIPLLTELAADRATSEQFSRIAGDETEQPWIRAVLAEAVAENYTGDGIHLLRDLIVDRQLDDDVRRWVRRRLASRKDEYGTFLSIGVTDPVKTQYWCGNARVLRDDEQLWTPGPAFNPPRSQVEVHALVTIAEDDNLDPDDRFKAAEALAGACEPRGLSVLLDLLEDTGLDLPLRYRAARALAQAGERSGLDGLRGFLERDELPSSRAHWFALVDLIKFGDDTLRAALVADRVVPMPEDLYYETVDLMMDSGSAEGVELLAGLASNQEIDEWVRLYIAASLAGRGDERGTEVLRSVPLTSDNWIFAAEALIAAGDRAPLARLRHLAGDHAAAPEQRFRAAQLLAAQGETDCLRTLARATGGLSEILTSLLHGDDEATGLLIACGRDELPWNECSYILEVLREHERFDVLRALAEDHFVHPELRHICAVALPDQDTEIALRVFDDIASDSTVSIHERADAARMLAVRGGCRGIELVHRMITDTALTDEGYDRVWSSTSLAIDGYEGDVLEPMTSIADDDRVPGDVRLRAAKRLILSGSPHGGAVAEMLAGNTDLDFGDRWLTVLALCDANPSDGCRVLRAMGESADSLHERYCLGESLARYGDPAGSAYLLDILHALAEGADPGGEVERKSPGGATFITSERVDAEQVASTFAEHRGVDDLVALVRDRTWPYGLRADIGTAILAKSAETGRELLSELLVEPKAPEGDRTQIAFRLAIEGDEDAWRITRSSWDSGSTPG